MLAIVNIVSERRSSGSGWKPKLTSALFAHQGWIDSKGFGVDQPSGDMAVRGCVIHGDIFKLLDQNPELAWSEQCRKGYRSNLERNGGLPRPLIVAGEEEISWCVCEEQPLSSFGTTFAITSHCGGTLKASLTFANKLLLLDILSSRRVQSVRRLAKF